MQLNQNYKLGNELNCGEKKENYATNSLTTSIEEQICKDTFHNWTKMKAGWEGGQAMANDNNKSEQSH